MQIMMLSNFGYKLVLMKPFFVVSNKFCEVNSVEDNLFDIIVLKNFLILSCISLSFRKRN
jgi:hypothetical protein